MSGVIPGEVCSHVMSYRGAVAFRAGSISSRPQQGFAGFSGQTAIAYKASASASGTDTFLVVMETESGGAVTRTPVTYLVQFGSR